jgi:hypothetical protein
VTIAGSDLRIVMYGEVAPLLAEVKGHSEYARLCAGVPEGYNQFIDTLVTMICFEIVYFGYPCGFLSNV